MVKTIIKILIIALIYLNITDVSAEYKFKIEDRIKINSIDKKISKYISGKNNSYFLAKRLKNKIEKILWKSEKEIIEKYNNRKSKYKDFKEFALTDIYWKIKTINISWVKSKGQYHSYNYKETILENDYIKILIDKKYLSQNKYDIKLNNESLIIDYWKWNKVKHLEFFKINTEEKTDNYINNNFIEKKYIWKCKAQLINNNSVSLKKYKRYYIKAYWNYINKSNSDIDYWKTEPKDCWKYWIKYWLQNFYRISPEIIMYEFNWSYEYLGFDLWSIEVKIKK